MGADNRSPSLPRRVARRVLPDGLRRKLLRASGRLPQPTGPLATPRTPLGTAAGETAIEGPFGEDGFVAVDRVLSPEECATFLDLLRGSPPPGPLDWDKGYAPTSRLHYEIATHPRVLDLVCEVLGPNVVLWGASIVERHPGAAHAWHTDIESSAPDGRTATIWLGLENTTADSSLTVVSRSHRFGASVQEVAAAHGRRRGEVTDEDVARWAGERDPESRIAVAAVADGGAVAFDGRLWHSSLNLDQARTRTALLLQYATADTPIRLHDVNHLEWPFRRLDEPRPPCVLVRGDAQAEPNRIVPAPLRGGKRTRLTTHVQRLPIASAPEPDAWRPYPLFRGTTPDIAELGCHVSALAPGHSPHEPHRHSEEELLLVLHGEADLVLPELPASDGAFRHRARRGQLAYYPAGFDHTIEAVGHEPATYLMLKWRAAPTGSSGNMAPAIFDLDAPGFVFESPTAWLRKLHCHVTTLQPGGGYEPHTDAYDVVIVTLAGEVETLGHRVGPEHVILYAAGEPHGMRCVGSAPARYVVFELHGSQNAFRNRVHAA